MRRGIFDILVALCLFALATYFILMPEYIDGAPRSKNKPTKLIILSIDGFPGSYFQVKEIRDLIPNLVKFSEKSAFSSTIHTVNPSVTYPAHTSMITGEDPGVHGIYNNTLVDPFEKNDGGWMWYDEDIKVPTLWKIAKRQNRKMANVFWPVTVGADIKWNLPQYWRKKISEDDKLLRALSTKGLHKSAELAVGELLNDTTKDNVKFKVGAWLFNSRKPDLLLLYTTELDSIHHAYGAYSEKAKEKLKEIDNLLGDFLLKIDLYRRDDLALIIISDHGFYSADMTCAPNLYLFHKGHIQTEENTYDWIFKSSGGSAILLPGKKKPTSNELDSMGKELMSFCPGVSWSVAKTPVSDEVTKQHPEALAWLHSGEKIYFSGTRKGEIFSENKQPIYGHGYDKEIPEMKTIGGVYWKGMKDKEAWRMDSVKDVFNRACAILNLKCPKRKL